MRSRRIPVRFALVLTSFLLACLLAEIMARFYLTRLAPPEIFDRYASLEQLTERYGQPRHINHRYLGFALNPDYRSGTNRHNSRGFRGDEVLVPKPEGIFRIVCMGGSTTYSASVEDYHESYPFRLQQELHNIGYARVEVVNAGVFSYTSSEGLINFETRILDLQPDLVIIYDGVNDVDARLVWPPKVYTGDSSGYARRLPATTPPLLEQITLTRMVLVYFEWTEPHIALTRNFIDTPGTYVGNQFLNQYEDGIYPTDLFASAPVETILETNQPIYFERNLRNLIAIAAAHGVEVVLATFTASPAFVENGRASSPEFLSAYVEQNRVLRTIAETTPAFLFDFAAAMPLEARYFSDGVHYSAEGNLLRGSLYARYLIDSGLLPPGSDLPPSP